MYDPGLLSVQGLLQAQAPGDCGPILNLDHGGGGMCVRVRDRVLGWSLPGFSPLSACP